MVDVLQHAGVVHLQLLHGMPGEQRLGTAIAIELQQPFAMSATNPARMAGPP